ncbi:PA14 domain-containing protein [Spirilliplanes yamanashiensis]|uniref:PA14 domain-containing protein n=1 Tax=Spirilliplanes yamanashiensis TaxID=42233 RepID=A0A8J3Y487_9ACTN|nr:PA14 domain-containing protein [Spirilliplanes yamanashiensis]MDP9819977.1 glucose/arabinose dehydrogenase [Spirilliplanes yamanashiensis]GIJ01204.1 hypothetical protein Sya03_05560 [Spirilliplanes yamanashiensis]
MVLSRIAERPNTRILLILLVSVVLLVPSLLAVRTGSASAAVPTGFREVTAFSGLVNPTSVRFAPDGRIFVAEKRGTVQMYDSLTDTTATRVADLRTEVHNFWDRGLLGLEIDPGFATGRPYLYVLYTFDGAVGGTAPRWGTAGADSDPCPSPPGATSDGCVVSGKLAKLTLSGTTTSKQDLIHDWCQQYPSHSIGDLAFGSDGALYVSAGDGASFDFVDYGQDGNPVNPCGDPPGGVGGTLTAPLAEGGALRSQDLRTPTDPTTLDGSVIRVSPDTGAALPDNPGIAATNANARRIVAYGLRNPFRMTARPGTSELWLGDVGWSSFEEINRITNPAGSVKNFGWPCFEGDNRQAGYDGADLKLCEDLYAQANADTKAYYSYKHRTPLNGNDNCNTTRGSSTAGVSFAFAAAGGPYPAEYDGALFFGDYSRNCIWYMPKGVDGQPDKLKAKPFVSAAKTPVGLEMSPQGELFYADFDGGTIQRIRYDAATNPTTCATGQFRAEYFPNKTLTGSAASTVCEAAPLNHDWGTGAPAGVGPDNFSARWTGTFDVAAAGTYTFTAVSDDGIRVWVDGTILIDQWRDQAATTFTGSRALTAGAHEVKVEWFETGGAAVAKLNWATTGAGSAPQPQITTPAAGTTWKVGDTVSFSGSASDPQDGTLPAGALRWEMILQHCPLDCHAHPLQSWTGVSGASIAAPDHEYPSHLELRLTATDSGGNSTTVSRRLDPQTVQITVASNPSGLQATSGSRTAVTPFTNTVIVGSSNSLSAPSPQTLSGTSYAFSRWSDGGGQSHNITAGATATTYTATYTATTGCAAGQYRAEYFPNKTLTGAAASTVCEAAPLNHDWGTGAPAGVGPDNFSARWTGAFTFATAGTYTFTAVTDDGIRVWVDGTLLMDQWRDQPATAYTASRALTAGAHEVKVEWFETGGHAVAKLNWAAACPVGQYRADYFPNRTLSGTPASGGCEAAPLNKQWGSGGPAGTPTDTFSARWQGTFNFVGGSTSFSAAWDDGMRVWVDGTLIVDRWTSSPGTAAPTVNLTAGAHVVRVEFQENTGTATARLSW